MSGSSENLFDHALRPVTTENIYKNLDRGVSLNVYAAKDKGMDRMLEDLEQAARRHQTAVEVIHLTMRYFVDKFEEFGKQLYPKLGLKEQATPSGSLESAIDTTFTQQNKKCWIFLEEFDALLDNPEIDAGFDNPFYGYLNILKQHPSVSLLCATEKIIKSYTYYTKTENAAGNIETKQHGSSPLVFSEKKELLALKEYEISQELKRRIAPLNTWMESWQIDRLVQGVGSTHSSWLLLQHSIGVIEEEREGLKVLDTKAFETWWNTSEADWKKNYAPSLERKVLAKQKEAGKLRRLFIGVLAIFIGKQSSEKAVAKVKVKLWQKLTGGAIVGGGSLWLAFQEYIKEFIEGLLK
ncbi:hypothetical protein R9C00_25880 [Flammeovirgaceae bacterium SG7u.111]|nr:hypothetical protein [Flammeovirgaceae bacterium SG7u.132]WPO35128.1 hypothetical protein R9C00_25880 [Flammeovirgaceae bacterium SG7u.111]